jgi:protein involved in polysaccharide export with SLBB domain
MTNLTTVPGRVIAPAWLQPDTNAFTLGPGDRLEIELIGDPATRAPALVGPDGKIYFYLLPGVEVWGMTITQAKAALEEQLQNLIRKEPKVSITLRAAESKRVWLLGSLSRPGLYPLSAPVTLLEAIATAGGTTPPVPTFSINAAFGAAGSAASTEVADLRRSFVIRQGQVLPVDFMRLLQEGDLSQNIYLQPDDFIYLPSAAAREVYVLGAVGQPRAVAYADRLSLVAAVANAGGTIKDAYLSHVAVVRGSLAHPQIAIVNYHDIIRGRTTDVLLEARDIVYVPFTPYQILTRYTDLVLTTFARTVGANAGARAISPNAGPVSPNVNINGTVGTPAR